MSTSPDLKLTGIWSRAYASWLRNLLIGPLLFLVLLTWAVASPPGASHDDNYHLASAFCGGGYQINICEPSTTEGARKIPQGIASIADCYWPNRAPDPGKCVTESGYVNESRMVDSLSTNSDDLYPPLFYATNSLLVSEDYEASIFSMRALNSLVFVILFLLAYFVLGRRVGDFFLIGLLLCSVPLGFYLIASNNPSSWGIASVATYWVFYYRFWLADDWKKWISLVGGVLAFVVAVGSRADAALYVGLSTALVTIAIQHLFPIRQRISLIITTLTVGVISAIFAFNTEQGTVITEGFQNSQVGRNAIDVLFYNLVHIPEVVFGSFGYGRQGALGWINTPVPPTVTISVIALIITLVARSLYRQETRPQIVTGLLILIIFALPVFILQKDLNMVGEYMQPRYVFPLIYVLVGMSIVFPHRTAFNLSKASLWSLLVLLQIAYMTVLWVTVKQHSTGYAYASGLKISWWLPHIPSPNVLWLISSIGFFMLIYTATASLMQNALPVDITSNEK